MQHQSKRRVETNMIYFMEVALLKVLIEEQEEGMNDWRQNE